MLNSTRIFFVAAHILTKNYELGVRISAKDLAAAIGVTNGAIMPALRFLTQAGLLRSKVGGIDPGFIYARNPREISVLEILEALEGKNEMSCYRDSLEGGIICMCDECDNCLIYMAYKDTLEVLKNKLINMSIYDHYQQALKHPSKDIV